MGWAITLHFSLAGPRKGGHQKGWVTWVGVEGFGSINGSMPSQDAGEWSATNATGLVGEGRPPSLLPFLLPQLKITCCLAAHLAHTLLGLLA